LLIAQIAANTERFASAAAGDALELTRLFPRAERFYPGRVDLGIGRATGGDPLASEALLAHRSRIPKANAFTQQLTDQLTTCGTLEPDHQFAQVKAQPGLVPASSQRLYGCWDQVFRVQLWLQAERLLLCEDFLPVARVRLV